MSGFFFAASHKILLRSFDHLPLLDAACTDANPQNLTVDFCPHTPEVGKPPPTGPVVGVTDVVAADRLFPAYFTYFCHTFLLSVSSMKSDA